MYPARTTIESPDPAGKSCAPVDHRVPFAHRAPNTYRTAPDALSASPLWAAILVGGRSRRMGTPKAALPWGRRTFLETTVDLLRPFACTIAVVGRIPDGVTLPASPAAGAQRIVHLADDPAGEGPLAGIVSAAASNPQATWLILPCDMPGQTAESIDWLLASHRPASPVTVARLPGAANVEPFPLVLGPGMQTALRHLLRSGCRSLQSALAALKATSIACPAHLTACWHNINTPEDFSHVTEVRR